MSFKYHLIIIIVCILIFVITAPAIILYSQGYRYDFRNHRLTKTGNLLINSIPAGASVIIDGRLQKPRWYHQLLFYKKFFGLTMVQSTTPTAISNFLPGKYQILIKKPNYYSWQKNLEIQAEKTTNVGKINLFLERSVPQLIIRDNIDFVYPLTDREKIIYATYNPDQQISEIILVSLNKPLEKKVLAKINSRVLKIEEFSNYILISSQGPKFFIITLPNSQIINLSSQIKNLQKVKYYDNLFYSQSVNTIYSFDPKAKQTKSIFNLNYYYQGTAADYKNSSLVDWLIKDNYLYLLIKNSNKIFLDKHHLEDSPAKYKLKSAIYNLDLPTYQFNFFPKQINNNLIILRTDRDIFIVDDSRQINPIIFKNRANNIIFQRDAPRILYFNAFEIFLAELVKNFEEETQVKNELINRSSQSISQVIWHPNNTHLITASKNNIWAIEIDSRDVRNIYKLLEMEEIKNIWFTTNRRFLYILGKINNQEGIWQVQIQ